MSSFLIRNSSHQHSPQSTTAHYRFGDSSTSKGSVPQMSNVPGSSSDYPNDPASVMTRNAEGSSFSNLNSYESSSPGGTRPNDPLANAFIAIADLFTGTVIKHPCTVLRRQCQVHQFARSLHLTPLTLAPVVCNMITGEGMLTLWKGAIGSGVLLAMTAATEVLAADLLGLPRSVVRPANTEKFWRHVGLKATTYLAMTPFFVSSFIETVRSETGLAGDDIRVLDVITNGINRLRFDLLGPKDNSKRFTLFYLSVPTVCYHTSHYVIASFTNVWLYQVAKRYVNKKTPGERTLFHRYLPQVFAAMTSQVLADVVCYPFETILHRLYIQGTRTLIDNLDNGASAISITAKYSGFFDCLMSVVRREGFWALYSGLGALSLQYLLHFSFLRLVRWIFEYGTRALTTQQQVTPAVTPPVFTGTSHTPPSSQFAFQPPTATSPKRTQYPTFGQTSASAFGSSTSGVNPFGQPSDIFSSRPLNPLLLSTGYASDEGARDFYGRRD